MKRFTKVICLILVVATVAVFPVSASAGNSSRASMFFAVTSTYIYPTSGAQFQVWFDLVGVEMMDKIGVSSIKVQRSSDKSNWTTMFTYLPEYYSQMVATNTTSHASYVPYHGTAGYYYRALVTFYAKNSKGTGELDRYTGTYYIQPTG